MRFNFKNNDQQLKPIANYAPGKRPLSKIYWYILLVVIISPFVYLGYNIFSETFLMKATGSVTFGEMTLRAPASAYVKSLAVRPGDSFKTGDMLVELSSPLLATQLKSLQNDIALLQQEKAKFLADSSELNQLLIARQAASKYIADCNEYLGSIQSLRNGGLTTIVDMEKARFDLNIAEQQYSALQGDIARLQVTRKLQSEEFFDKSLRDLEAKVNSTKTLISQLQIKAAQDGTLAKYLVQEEEYVKDGQDIAKIVVNKDAFVTAYVESKFLSDKLKAGQKVRILFPDGVKIKGDISDTPVYAESDPGKSSLVQNDKNKILVRIVPQEDIPTQYRIAGLPVEVLFY